VRGRFARRAGHALLFAAGLALTGPAAAAEAAEGEERIPPEANVCLGCHTVDKAERRGADAAPPLWGVLGRASTVEGLDGRVWTRERLNRWIANPRAMAPRTRSRFPGFADPETRKRVVRFLSQRR